MQFYTYIVQYYIYCTTNIKVLVLPWVRVFSLNNKHSGIKAQNNNNKNYHEKNFFSMGYIKHILTNRNYFKQECEDRVSIHKRQFYF